MNFRAPHAMPIKLRKVIPPWEIVVPAQSRGPAAGFPALPRLEEEEGERIDVAARVRSTVPIRTAKDWSCRSISRCITIRLSNLVFFRQVVSNRIKLERRVEQIRFLDVASRAGLRRK
jgi:hypothetical protein